MWLFCQTKVILKYVDEQKMSRSVPPKGIMRSFQILQEEGRGRGEELHKIKRGARFTRGAEQGHMRPEEQQGKIYSRDT